MGEAAPEAEADAPAPVVAEATPEAPEAEVEEPATAELDEPPPAEVEVAEGPMRPLVMLTRLMRKRRDRVSP